MQQQGERVCTIQAARARSFDGQTLPSINDRERVNDESMMWL